jgi:DNA polymerase III subunit beta
MKVICNRGALVEALSVAGTIVAARTPKPALQCVKLTAEADRLIIAATDLEVAIRYTDSLVTVEQQGEALVPADKLRDIVRESSDDTLSIEQSGETADIKGQDALFKIFTQKPSDFPPIPDFEGEPQFELSGAILKRLISQTLFAVARESTRYAFNAVLISAKAKKVMMVATDGRRLALARGELSADRLGKETAQAMVPAKALSLLEKLIDSPDDAIGVQISENRILFRTPSATLSSNLVEGQFPPYDEVVPKDSDKKLLATTADLLSAIRRAALLTTEESRGVRMAFSNKGLVLTSRSPEAGEATVNFPAKFEGADIEIGFNPHFLTDALKIVNSDEVSLELTAPNRPGLLRAGPDFQYVIMPVNLT